MAKRKTRRSSSPARARQVTVRQAAPIVIRSSSAPARTSRKRRSGGGKRRGGSDGSLGKTAMAVGLGGAAVGWIEKTWPNLPSISIVGRKGTIALAAYFLRGKLPYAREVCLAAAAIAGYQFGSEGKVTGYDDDYYDPGVHGVASQV